MTKKLFLIAITLIGMVAVPVGTTSASAGPLTCVPGVKHTIVTVGITSDLRQYPALDAPRGCGGVIGNHNYNADCLEADATGAGRYWVRVQGNASLWGFIPKGNVSHADWSKVDLCR